MSAEDPVNESAPDEVAPNGPRYPGLLYTLARVGLFGAAAGLLYLLGARSWFLVILALVVSGLLSYILLGSLRDAMSRRIDSRVAQKRARREAITHAEDDLL